MSTPFTQCRERIADLIRARVALENVSVFVERDGEDFDEAFETSINEKGLAIVVLEEDAAVSNQSSAGGVAVLNLVVPIAVLDNVEVNMRGESGLKIPSGQVLYEVMVSLIGKDAGDGEITLGHQAFARLDENAGLIERYLSVMAPVVVVGS